MSDMQPGAQAGPEGLRQGAVWFIGIGALLLLLGLLALFNLFAATIASVFFIGVLMIVGGALRVAHAFRVERTASLLFWLLSGLLYAVAGGMALANPALGAAALTLVLAAALIASGVVMIAACVVSQARDGRWWILLSGVLTSATGLILAAGWPLTGVWALGLILALDLTFQGWALIAFGFALKAMERRAHGA